MPLESHTVNAGNLTMAPLKSKNAVVARDAAEAGSVTGTGAGERRRDLEGAVIACNDANGYAREIGKLWDDAQAKFVTIGRCLLLAKQTLPHGAYEHMVATMLPFGASVARKLRAVAVALDAGRLKISSLPRSYENAYALAVLSDRELEIAENRQVVRPDVTRREIDSFRREIRNPAHDERRSHLMRQRERHLARIKILQGHIGRLQVSIAEIDAELERAAPLTIHG